MLFKKTKVFPFSEDASGNSIKVPKLPCIGGKPIVTLFEIRTPFTVAQIGNGFTLLEGKKSYVLSK